MLSKFKQIKTFAQPLESAYYDSSKHDECFTTQGLANMNRSVVVTLEEMEAMRMRIDLALDTIDKGINGTTDEGRKKDISLLLDVLADMADIADRQARELQNIKNRPMVSAFP